MHPTEKCIPWQGKTKKKQKWCPIVLLWRSSVSVSISLTNVIY